MQHIDPISAMIRHYVKCLSFCMKSLELFQEMLSFCWYPGLAGDTSGDKMCYFCNAIIMCLTDCEDFFLLLFPTHLV